MNTINRISSNEFEVYSEASGAFITIDLNAAATAADEALKTGAGTRMLVPDWDEDQPKEFPQDL